MALSATELKNLIISEINSRKVDTTNVASFDSTGAATETTTKQLPNDDGVALMEAIATAVIAYIKSNLEIEYTLNLDTDNFTITPSSPLQGTGGGVPGPVVIPNVPITPSTGSIKIKIPAGNVK